MSAKPTDRDEVALLMQQQGLSRVQATKLLYEMTKQRKKEEAAAAAARAGSKSPILEIIQNDNSVVKQHIERYSSQKELVSVPSQLHLDVDFSNARPTLKLDPESAQRYKSVGSVGVMSAAIESKYNSYSAKSNTSEANDEDFCEEDSVIPYDEDKFASESLLLTPVPLQEELSPTAVAGTGTSPPSRRRSSNSALDLRPLSRLHPTKFGKEGADGDIASADDSGGAGGGEEEEGYRSGESSDGEFEEQVLAGPAPVHVPVHVPDLEPAVPDTVEAQLPHTRAPAPASVSQPVPVPPAAKAAASSEKVGNGVSATASGLESSAQNATAPIDNAYSYEHGSVRPELDNTSSEFGLNTTTNASSSASLSSFSSATATATASSESKTTFSSRTLTSRVQPPPQVPVQQLALEEKVALINAGRYTALPAVAVSSSGTAQAAGASLTSPVARANEVMNVKVGSKKLTVRASFNAGSGGGLSRTALAAGGSQEPPPPAYGDFPPPPAYEDTVPAAPPAAAAMMSPPTSIPSAPAPAARPPASLLRAPPATPSPSETSAPQMQPPSPISVLKRPSIPQSPGHASLKEYSTLTPVPEELLSPSVSPAAVPHPVVASAEPADALPDFEGSDIEESDDEEGKQDERKKMMKFNRRSYIKKDQLPEAFKDLAPIDPLVVVELLRQEQEEKAAAAALQAQRNSTVGQATRTVQSTSAFSAIESSTSRLGSEFAAPSAIGVGAPPPAGASAKEGSDLVEELIAQGYSRENALTLAKEIELDRRADRFVMAPRNANGAAGVGAGAGMGSVSSYPDAASAYRGPGSVPGLGAPVRSGSSVVSHTSSHNYGGYRERTSFDRSFNNEDETGSVVSNISAASRQSSLCENDKLLMNLLLSQQKGRYGVNMYESLTNHDEPAIERYMSRGLTLDQAVLKVFEKKYGSVDNQSMPRSIYAVSSSNSGVSSKAPSSVNYDAADSQSQAQAHDIVETMHAEIELLMLSGGYSRDVAVKMLLSKVAKEKAMQNNQGNDHHVMHRAASMNAMPAPRGITAVEAEDPGYGARHMHAQGHEHHMEPQLQHQQQHAHTHTLHASRSMYAMPSSSSGASVNGGGSVASGRSSRSRPEATSTYAPPASYAPPPHQHQHQPPYSQYPPQPEAAFPTQFPPHSSAHSGHGSQRRPSGSNLSVASAGKMSVASGASSITKLDSRDSDYIPSVVAQQEAVYGVNMYDYLAPDDPGVARLMGQFGFNKVDAMIAVFQQFPPQIQPHSGSSRDSSRANHTAAVNRYPGSGNGSAADSRPAPTNRRTAESAPKKAAPAPYDEAAELERVLRLSALEQQNTPGAVSMPGLGGGSGGSGGPAGRNGHGASFSGGSASSRPGPGPHPSSRQASNHDIMSLVGMGFTSAQAQAALARNNNDVHAAADYLLRGL